MALKGILKLKSGSVASLGDVVVIDGKEIDICINEKDRKAIGLVMEPSQKSSDANVPLMDIFGDEYFQSGTPSSDPDFVFVIVEGFCPLGKICDEDGPVSAGDLLVSANKDGFLKKQTTDGTTYDNTLRDYTVARAIEDVTFDGSGEATGINVYVLK